jgi:hypothetical protein
MKLRLSFLFLALVPVFSVPAGNSWSQTKASADSSHVESAQRKLEHVQSNGTQPHPDPAATEFTEQEINAYFASGSVKLPAGVQSAVFQEQPGVVIGTSRVDFDPLKGGRNSYNPLLSAFSGLHDVVVTAHASAVHGQGQVHVDSVSIDGVEIPPFVLGLFVEKYLKPRYPNVGIDSRFALPARIDAATVGWQKVRLTQR